MVRTCGKFVNLVHSSGDLVSQICVNVPVLGKEQSIHPAFYSNFFCISPIVTNVGAHLSNTVCVTCADRSAMSAKRGINLFGKERWLQSTKSIKN